MSNNNNTLATVQLPKGRQIMTPKGKVCGERFTFAGASTAKELRDQFKTAGLKGKELTRKVNDTLAGKQQAATVMAGAFLTTLCTEGYIPDYGDRRDKSAVIKFVRQTDIRATKAEEINVDAMSQEDRDALLEALLASKK